MSGIVLPALDTALDCSVAPGYSALGYWLRGLRWDNAVAGRLDGGAAVVTGASSGLGVAAVEGLARAGARVHLVVRDRERGERARDEVLQRLGAAADLRVALCDLAELESVARLAADLAEREPDLAVLVNNAGVLAERRERSSSGAELTFATNVLGPFALTELLLPALRAGTPGRVVTVSSGGMYTARLDGADLQLDHRTFRRPALLRPHQAGRGRPQRAAGSAARARPACASPPCTRAGPTRRACSARCPASTGSMRPLLRDARQGADTIVWLATAPAAEVPGGRFWHDRRPRPTHRLPRTHESAEDRRALWRESPAAGDPHEPRDRRRRRRRVRARRRLRARQGRPRRPPVRGGRPRRAGTPTRSRSRPRPDARTSTPASSCSTTATTPTSSACSPSSAWRRNRPT